MKLMMQVQDQVVMLQELLSLKLTVLLVVQQVFFEDIVPTRPLNILSVLFR